MLDDNLPGVRRLTRDTFGPVIGELVHEDLQICVVKQFVKLNLMAEPQLTIAQYTSWIKSGLWSIILQNCDLLTLLAVEVA